MRTPSALWLISAASALPVLGIAQGFPSAATVLDRFVEVTGGANRYEKLTTQVQSGRVELSSQQIQGTLTIFRAAPNRVRTVMELPLGIIEEGFDGTTAWAKSPMMRPRIKEDREKANAAAAAIFSADAHWREQFATVETLALETVDGHDCYRILATGHGSTPQTRYYDKVTGLLVKLSMVVPTPLGDIPADTLFSDYRADHGIVSAHRWVQTVAGQRIATTIDKVEYNAALPPDRFALPADIQALSGK